MTDIFITGDRSVDPLTAIPMVLKALEHSGVQESDTLATGSMEFGIERAVRYLLRADQLVYSTNDEGKPDFDGLFEVVAKTFDKVVFVHSDPLASKIGASLVKVVPADKLVFVTPN